MGLSTLVPGGQGARDFALQAFDLARDWLQSPAAWSQLALLVLAYAVAAVAVRRMGPALGRWLAPPADHAGPLAKLRRFALMFLPLLLPLLAYALTALGETITRTMFDSGAIIAFGKRVFLFVAARILVRDILRSPLPRAMGRFVVLPVAALYVLGLLLPLANVLENTTVPLGNLSFNLLWLLQFVVVGAGLFWLGRWSNSQSAQFLQTQEQLRPATRQLAEKAAEVAIFGAAFLIAMNIMGVSLTSLAVLGGAVGVGLGFGLQKIASNFISGVILLLEGQTTVGDYVELDGGQAGTIVKMTARAAILETFDGKWVVVPNEDFIVTRVVNYSDAGSAKRYEAPFSVAYDTDINRVPALIEAAVAALPFVLQQPDPPDCELRGFGESGVDFACEFWVNGIDDGKNRYTSQVLFAIWNALKDNGIEIPYPHRVVELRSPIAQAAITHAPAAPPP